MAYLEEFTIHLANQDFNRFLQLWEEYCASDAVDAPEYKQILLVVKDSELSREVGRFVETGLPLWSLIQDQQLSFDVLRLILDLQTTNSEVLAETATKVLKERHTEDKLFNTKLRLVGLRDKKAFKGALTNYELLTHMDKGRFVFHTGGWGAGEIVEISLVREELIIEFENVTGKKSVSFENAFNTLIPLPETHFLSKRFANPDKLEKEARQDPAQVLKDYLRDMGQRTASEIKDDFLDLVIPKEEWSKWWQLARSKLKKDPSIISPSSTKDAFRLRTEDVSHEEQLVASLGEAKSFEDVLLTSYNYVRDLPDLLKNKELKEQLIARFVEWMTEGGLTTSQELQAALFLESFFHHEVPLRSVQELITKVDNVKKVIDEIPIIALKKRALIAIFEHRSDWQPLFLDFLFTLSHSGLRDYVLKELQNPKGIAALEEALLELRAHPQRHPETFIWYFQKVISTNDVPFSDKEGQCRFFESFLTLYQFLEDEPEYKELVRKMYNIMSGKRWEAVRSILEGSSLEFCREFILLASKCHTLSDHDLKTFRALCHVVHPSLKQLEGTTSVAASQDGVVWTTQHGYDKTCARIKEIGEKEMLDNAKEIEQARSHGDLRENAEYKAALERRDRLQAELKMLSNQLNKARILTEQDIITSEVGVGSVVKVRDQKGVEASFTILGPWDADPERRVLSFNSKLAQTMLGLRIGDKFTFKDDQFVVQGVKSYLGK